MFLCICNNTATTKIYTYRHTLSLRDALPICSLVTPGLGVCPEVVDLFGRPLVGVSIGSGERGTHGSSDAIAGSRGDVHAETARLVGERVVECERGAHRAHGARCYRRVPSVSSEERRVGKACGSTCRSRWSAYH